MAPLRLAMGHQLSDNGTPEWTAQFKKWLTNQFSASFVATDEPCEHPAKAPGALCSRCSVFNEDGTPISETGRYRYTRLVYWFPMRAATARIARSRVPNGFPSFGVTLMFLVNAGSVARALIALSDQYPILDGEGAARHLSLALERVRAAYADAPVPRRSRATRSVKTATLGRQPPVPLSTGSWLCRRPGCVNVNPNPRAWCAKCGASSHGASSRPIRTY